MAQRFLHKLRYRAALTFLALAALLLTSCTRRIGWAVVLWSGSELQEESLESVLSLPVESADFLPGDSGDGGFDEDVPPVAVAGEALDDNLQADADLRAGQIVPVYLKSGIQKLYVVGVPGTRRKAEISQWRVSFFSSKRKAKAFLNDFSPCIDTFALATRDGLPVRERADNNANRVYRLRSGEAVKVIMKTQGREVSSGGQKLAGDWYLILTKDGTQGYSFSNTLRMFDAQDQGLPEDLSGAPQGEADAALDEFMLKTWRPEGFRTMIDRDRYDLSSFQTRYGLFPDPASRRIRIELPDYSGKFDYREPVKLNSRRWAFNGTNLQLELRGDDVALATFPDDNGRSMNRFFVLIEEDIDALAAAEESRRQDIFNSILGYGRSCVSEGFGALSLASSRRFTWSGHGAWRPYPIHDEAGDEGSLEFDVYLDPSLIETWDGVITFRFDGARRRPARFYWTAGEDGLWLEPLPLDGLDPSGLVAVKRSPRPLQGHFVWISE